MASALGFFLGLAIFPIRFFPFLARVALALAFAVLAAPIGTSGATELFLLSGKSLPNFSWSEFVGPLMLGVMAAFSLLIPVVGAVLLGRWVAVVGQSPANVTPLRMKGLETCLALLVMSAIFTADRLGPLFGLLADQTKPVILQQGGFAALATQLLSVGLFSTCVLAIPFFAASLFFDLCILFFSRYSSQGLAHACMSLKLPIMMLFLSLILHTVSQGLVVLFAEGAA